MTVEEVYVDEAGAVWRTIRRERHPQTGASLLAQKADGCTRVVSPASVAHQRQVREMQGREEE